MTLSYSRPPDLSIIAESSVADASSSAPLRPSSAAIMQALQAPREIMVLAPDEGYRESIAQMKQCIKMHGWDAAAMFFGTLVYMGVYYAAPYFAVFGSAGGYILHNLMMGVAANAAAVPFVWKGRLAEGKTNAEAKRDSFRYFLLCTVPDSLYQPVQDWFVAMCNSGSLIDFDFVQDAVSTFSKEELVASFSTFGVGFGILYFCMKKLLIKHDDAEEEVSQKFDDKWQQFYKKTSELLQTPTWESIKSALQYFIFYLSDYFFDTSLTTPGKTLLNLFGCCMWMSGYSFLFDSLPELFGFLQARRERVLRTVMIEEAAEDYLNISDVHVTEENVEEDEFVLLTAEPKNPAPLMTPVSDVSDAVGSKGGVSTTSEGSESSSEPDLSQPEQDSSDDEVYAAARVVVEEEVELQPRSAADSVSVLASGLAAGALQRLSTFHYSLKTASEALVSVVSKVHGVGSAP